MIIQVWKCMHILFNYQTARLSEKMYGTYRCFIFLYIFCLNKSKYVRSHIQNTHRCTCLFMWSVLCFVPLLTKIGMGQILIKLPNKKFHANLFSSSWIVSCIQIDWANLVGFAGFQMRLKISAFNRNQESVPLHMGHSHPSEA